MKWVGTNGGPYIVLPWEHRAAWEGSELPADGRIVRAKFRWDDPANAATDYDEACDRTGPPDWFGPVKRPAFTALALPRGSLTWMPRPRGGVLVHCVMAPSSAHLAKVVRAAFGPKVAGEPVRWRRTRAVLKTALGKLVACDGAYPGREQPRQMTLTFAPGRGTYAVSVADCAPDEGTELRVFRLTAR